MNETVVVALIVAAAGVTPALIASRRARHQTLDQAQVEHLDWIRRERFQASSALLEHATLLPNRCAAIRTRRDGGFIDGKEATDLYVDAIEPLVVYASRISVLGPGDLLTASTRLLEAALADGGPLLKAPRTGGSPLGEEHDNARLKFVTTARATMAMPQWDTRRSRARRWWAARGRKEIEASGEDAGAPGEPATPLPDPPS